MAISGTTSGPELLVELDRAGPEPLHRQLANGLRDAIRTGRLAPETRLPSTPGARDRSRGVAPPRRGRVQPAGRRGVPAQQAWVGHAGGDGRRRQRAVAARSNPRPATTSTSLPGSPDLGSFPRHAWLRALRQGLAEIESRCIRLRRAAGSAHRARRGGGLSAAHPRRARRPAAHRAVFGGDAGDRPARPVLRSHTLAMEDPGFWLHRMVLRHNGIEPVAGAGRRRRPGRRRAGDSGAQAVLATPAHQSPTGVVLSAARRTALMEWARADHLVIEDDYDAEYRYDRAPVGALQGIAPDRVVYVGSTSKTLAPGLRIGWMVLPAHLVGPVAMSKGLADTGSSVMDQLAFAQAVDDSGGYDRHLRQMRRRYLSGEMRCCGAGPLSAAGDGARCGGRCPPHGAVSRRLSRRGAGAPGGGDAGAGRAAGTVLRRPCLSAAGFDARLCQSHRVTDREGVRALARVMR